MADFIVGDRVKRISNGKIGVVASGPPPTTSPQPAPSVYVKFDGTSDVESVSVSDLERR